MAYGKDLSAFWGQNINILRLGDLHSRKEAAKCCFEANLVHAGAQRVADLAKHQKKVVEDFNPYQDYILGSIVLDKNTKVDQQNSKDV